MMVVQPNPVARCFQFTEFGYNICSETVIDYIEKSTEIVNKIIKKNTETVDNTYLN